MTSLAFDIRQRPAGLFKTVEGAPPPVLDVLRHPVLDVLNLDTVTRSNGKPQVRASAAGPLGRIMSIAHGFVPVVG
jgi:hypothetical protein